MPTRCVFAIGLITAATTAAACRSPDRRAPDARIPPIVTVTAREYAFNAPDSIEAGPTTIRLVSQGREQHFVQFIRIATPHTLSDFQHTLSTSNEVSWVTRAGGVGTIPPGGVAMTTLDLAPGLYAMLCDMEDATGTPHMMEGMLRALRVVGRRNAAVMPTADVVLDLTDYAFTLSTPLSAGTQAIDVRNVGSQPHMALLWRLHEGKSATDVVHWMDARSDPGPPPVTLVGGTPDLDVGHKVQLLLRLEPGHYVLICLVNDVHDHKPHYQHGMVREVMVGAASAR